MKRVSVFGVRYSPNLGDGLIAECLEYGLKQAGIDEVTSIDLAGRTTNRTGGGGSREALVGLLAPISPKTRGSLLRPLLEGMAHWFWRPHYVRLTASAGAVIIGGGNLFADFDLNFPIKLATALAVARDRSVPVIIAGVGVSETWSTAGLGLLRNELAQADVRSVFVRDQPSADNWNTLFAQAGSCQAELSLDFGLLASEVYPALSSPVRTARLIGLCPIGPSAIEYHSGRKVPEDGLIRWWSDLVESFRQRGCRVKLFTNGSPEDRRFLKKLSSALGQKFGSVGWSLVEPSTPKALCGLISNLDGLVAYRMHAVVAAYSYDVPFLALRWDIKVDAFFAAAKSDAVTVDVSELSPAAACARLEEQMAAPRDASGRQDSLRLLRAAISRIAETIQTTAPNAQS